MATPRPRILLVDDEPSIVKVVTKRLETAGFDVLPAASGQDGLSMAQTAKPDLIVLDLMMPGLNGFDVCRTLKDDAKYRHVPIVILTVKEYQEDRKLADDCGADAYVTKPFDPQELLDKIRALLPSSPPPS